LSLKKISLVWQRNLSINRIKFENMKKLAMVLAVAFTMGLAASTVTASTKEDKAKTTEKKECCAKTKDCSKEAKAACCKDKKAENKEKSK
jgi:hypothetical protein